MCSPIMSVVEQETDRRRFLRSMGARPSVWGSVAVGVHAQPQSPARLGPVLSVHFETVVDLTHVLEPNVPNYFRLNMEITPVLTIEQHGVFVNRLTVPEHYGTHFDTPAHFIRRGTTGESIEPKQPGRTPGDHRHRRALIVGSERRDHGGGSRTVGSAERPDPARRLRRDVFELGETLAHRGVLNEDDTGTYNFPGFGGDAARFLVEERDIIGIGCDSHSLDVGPSNSYPAHFAVLGAGKIGVENSRASTKCCAGRRPPQPGTGDNEPTADRHRWVEDARRVGQPGPSPGARKGRSAMKVVGDLAVSREVDGGKCLSALELTGAWFLEGRVSPRPVEKETARRGTPLLRRAAFNGDCRRAPERCRSLSRLPGAISDGGQQRQPASTCSTRRSGSTASMCSTERRARAARLSCCCCTASRPLLICFGT